MNSCSHAYLPARTPYITDVVSYLESGRLLHGIAITSLMLSYCSYGLARQAFLMNETAPYLIYAYFCIYFLILPFFAELDARSRYQNYKLIRDLMYRYGFRERFLKPLKHSKCQREAAFMAARDLGYAREAQEYFYRKGYRWYHILPDFIGYSPGYLLTKSFWITTFFTKTYHSKYYPG